MKTPPTRRPWAILIASVIALALVYVATARLGFSLHAATPRSLLVWAPSGIGLGAVIIFGAGIAPGIGIGAFCAAALAGVPIGASLLIGGIDTGEALIAAYLLRTYFEFHPSLDRVRDVLALVITALVVTLVDSMLISLGLVTLGVLPAGMFAGNVHQWWWAHLGGDLIVTPVVITWLTRTPDDIYHHRRTFERAALCLSVLLVSASVFYPGFPDLLPGTPRAYQVFPLLLWAGVRFGPRGAAATSFVVGVMAIVGTALGHDELMLLANLQSFVSISSVTTLLLAALHAERVAVARRKAAIQDAALDGILTLDTDGRILEFNPAAERLFRGSAGMMIGKDVSRLIVPGQRSTPVTRSAAGQRLRLRAVRADATEFPAEFALTKLELADADQDRYTAFVRDVTAEDTTALALEQKVAERTAALSRSEELLRTSERLAHIGSFEAEDGQIRCSDEILRMYGHDPATFMPTVEAFYAGVHVDDRERVRRTIERARETGGNFTFDHRIVRSDGTVRFVHTTGTSVNGKLSGCSQDITDSHVAEELKRRLIGIVESTEDAIIGLSLDSHIVSWNAAAERIFGYTAEQVIGRDVSVLVDSEAASRLGERTRAIRAGQHLSHYDLEHRRSDGTAFAASVTMSVIRDDDGQPVGFSKVLRDISHEKAIEATVLASLREKEVLLREIHHRVKNNLQVVSSLLNLQVENVPLGEARTALLESQNRIQSMALVHQQLYQSKDLASIDLLDYIQQLVQRIFTTYALHADKVMTEVRGAHLLVDIDHAIPCGLIVNELVTNAITHGFPDGRQGRVWVELSYTTTGARIDVGDDGVGMQSDVDIDTLKTFGLKISETLSHQLGGTLTFHRANGTTAVLTFPLTGDELLTQAA